MTNAYPDFDYTPTQRTALVQALVLAITASTDDQAERADELVQRLADGLTADDIEVAKRQAQDWLNYQEVR